MQLIKTIVNKFVTIWNRSERNHIDHYGMKPLQRLKRSLGEEQTMKKTNVACFTNNPRITPMVKPIAIRKIRGVST